MPQGLGFHAKPIFFRNILLLPSCNSDSSGRCTLNFVEVLVGELVQLGGANEDCLGICFVGLVAVGNYVWCLVIVVIFMGFEVAKRWGEPKVII